MPNASNNTYVREPNVIRVQGVARKYVACYSQFSFTKRSRFHISISGSVNLLVGLLAALLVTTVLG
jgi:hypothetical protein